MEKQILYGVYDINDNELLSGPFQTEVEAETKAEEWDEEFGKNSTYVDYYKENSAEMITIPFQTKVDLSVYDVYEYLGIPREVTLKTSSDDIELSGILAINTTSWGYNL